MRVYVEAAQALVTAGYLNGAAVDAAATILANALVVGEADVAEAAALQDEAYQEGVIAQAEAMAIQDAGMGDFLGEELDRGIVMDAATQQVRDETVIAATEAASFGAYADAAAALAAAGLIYSTNVRDAARVIADVITAFEFRCRLYPQPVEAGGVAAVTVENRTLEPRIFTVSHHSPNDVLAFEPGLPQTLRLPPGEVATAEFRAMPRKRRLFGGTVLYPFTSRVQSGDRVQTLSGQVVGQAMMPIGLAVAGLAVLLACACFSCLAIVYAVSMDRATPAPTVTLPEEVMTEPAMGDLWEQIQATGRIVVGTSADYPPFESYVNADQIDGFDIALMDEIGRRLGVQVQYLDYAFDGLGPALRLGDIDIALAAISRTPEREAVVDFSNVYLVGEDGVLAQEGSDLRLGSIDDAAQYRIGVQRNTVYQAWIQLVLVEAGRMSPDNLFAYEKPEHAVRDLRDGRIDLVLMDAQPAQAYVEQGGVKLVARGLNPQNYAIALPKGQSSLKAELDQVITALYNDGTIAGLAQRYLGMPQVLPTPIPVATSTAAPPPECVDGMTFIQDLTQEGDLKPGQAFTKGWQVQNTGTCTWNTGYHLSFADGYNMGGQPVAVTQDVAPGATYDLYINLIAPLNAGDYQGVWQMVNGQGIAFGERLQVNIGVTVGPTVTPEPTQTPVAGIIFTVDRNAIQAGECVNFAWKVDNVREVYFYAEGESWQNNGVAGEGTQVECPPVTTTFFLRVVLRDSSVEVREITIYVEPVADAPRITRFTVDPPGQITLGQCVTLRWLVEGELDLVLLTANDVVLWDGAPASGSHEDCPTVSGNVAYALEATGPGGTSRGQQNITVVDSATATPEPTAAPDLPVIYSFVVDPAQIEEGECVGISWSLGGGTTYSRILRNGMVIIDDAGYTGQEMDCLDTADSYTYQVDAYSTAGEVATEEQAVSVIEATP